MRIIVKTILSSFLFFLLFISGLSAQRLPSEKHYKQLKSKHFTVVYYSDKLNAEKILSIAENIHFKLAEKFLSDEKIHTYIVVVDNYDLANGLAGILPGNIIILFDMSPGSFTGFSILNYYNWLEMVITHEYTHILHLNQTDEFLWFLRFLGFKYLAPNLLLPISSIEGLAVCMETAYTPMGRARSSYMDMVFRTAVYEDNVPSIDEISTFVNKIPGGMGPYIWGGGFHYYLYNKVAEKKILRSYHKNGNCSSCLVGFIGSECLTTVCSCGTCFPFNSIFEKLTGLSYYKHYDEWVSYLEQHYKKEIVEIKNPTMPELLKGAGHFSHIFDLVYYKDKIYFSGASQHTGYGLYEYDFRFQKLKVIISDMFITSIALFKNKLYFPGLELYDNVYEYFSLYAYDLNTRELRNYSDIARVLDVEKFGEELLVVQTQDNGKNIRLINSDGIPDVSIMSIGKHESAYDFTFINENEFYFILKKTNDFFDIYHYNIEKKEFKRITNNPSIELSLFLDEGNLYFISDKDKGFNIYKYNIENKVFSRTTDFISGASRVIKSKNYYAVYFQSRGYTIGEVDAGKIKNIEIEYNSDTNYNNYSPAEEKSYTVDIMVSEEKNFSIIRNLFSGMMLLPSLTVVGNDYNPGIIFMFSDVLNRNILILQLAHSSFLDKFSGSIDYSLYRNKANYFFSASSLYNNYMGDKSLELLEYDIFRRNDNIMGEFQFLKNRLFRLSLLYLGASYYDRTYYMYKKGRADIQNIGRRSYNSVWAGLSFNNAISYAYSVVPEKGWYASTRYILMKEWFGSDFNVDLLDVTVNKYCRTFFRHHILRFNMQSGTMLNDSKDRAYEVRGLDLWRFPALYEKFLKAYSYYSKTGKNYFIGNISYNLPIVWPERGIKNMPLLFSHLWMKVFYETGNSYNDVNKFKPLQLIGAELHFEFIIYYRTTTDFSFGITRELNKEQANYFYMGYGLEY